MVQAHASGPPGSAPGTTLETAAATTSSSEIPDGHAPGHSQGSETAFAEPAPDSAQGNGRDAERADDALAGRRFSSSAADVRPTRRLALLLQRRRRGCRISRVTCPHMQEGMGTTHSACSTRAGPS